MKRSILAAATVAALLTACGTAAATRSSSVADYIKHKGIYAKYGEPLIVKNAKCRPDGKDDGRNRWYTCDVKVRDDYAKPKQTFWLRGERMFVPDPNTSPLDVAYCTVARRDPRCP